MTTEEQLKKLAQKTRERAKLWHIKCMINDDPIEYVVLTKIEHVLDDLAGDIEDCISE